MSSTPRRTSTRPWHKEKPVPAVTGPLVPEEYMEAGQQRMVAISIFVLLQAYKFYELLFCDNYSFTVKYFLVDSLFLWCLPILRIPWLTFSTSVTLLQIALMACFNAFLGNNALSFTGVLLGAWKGMFERELSISGAKVRSKDMDDTSSHLLGKYTVHILPESTAWLNPSKQSFCVENNQISLPIRLNATEPIFIQLNRVDFQTLEETSLNFTKKEIKKLRLEKKQDDSKLAYLGLPVGAPGLYRLKKVVDSSNLDVRVYQSDVLVTSCPSAYILSGANTGKCIGDTDTPKLVVDGVAPLKVKYSRSIKGRESLFSVQSVQPEGFMSPLIYGGLPQSGPIWRDQSADLSWAASSTVEVEMDTALTSTGQWTYNIEQVEDAFGNVIAYAGNDDKLLQSKGLSYGFVVHSRPQIKFKNCDAEKPLKLARGSEQELPISLIGDPENGPYNVAMERIDDDGTVHTLAETFKGSNMMRYKVSQPGVYKLKSVQGKYCSGDILESSSCVVYSPPEPSLAVDFTEITDKCAGAVGISAELSFTGTPPFRVAYRVSKDGKLVDSSSMVAAQSRETFSYKPHEAGTYKYEFHGLDDQLYQGIKLQDEFEQTIRALAGASFVGDTNRKSCSDGSVDFNVRLLGEAPFTLEYEITHGNAKRTKHSANVESNSYKITTPELKAGGRYTISLVSIQDANGCKNVLNEKDAVVEVRRQRPAAGFLPIDGSMSVKALEGETIGLPLRLSGEGPWDVTYRYYNEDDGSTEDTVVKVHNPNGDKLQVNKRGKYALVDVRDDCPGEVTDSGNVFELTWFNKPQMSVTSKSVEKKGEYNFVRAPVCEGAEDVFEVELKGAPPFSIYYDVKGPVSLDEQVQVATKFANIRMQTSKAGRYRYNFNQIGDSIYSDIKSSIMVEQTVFARPTTGFVHKNKVYKACAFAEENDPQLEPIQIQFNGKAPFALTYDVRSESTGKSQQFTVQNIQDKQYGLRSVYTGLTMGRHTVTLAKVQDAQGCVRELYDDSKVTIIVSDVPELNMNNKRDYCVGERLSFGLTGIPPFEVTYEFNSKKQRATTNSPFSRLASQPGNLTLVSLSDSASSCSKKLSNGPITIHPKPTVKVRDGDSVYHDIHEGDQAELIFQFTGTPPFSFTYTRSEMTGRPPRQKIIETHSVPMVNDYQYSVFTSMQGIYEVVALQDAYCSVTMTK